jgi:lysophospholipid acyltransferase (LPLAT)-like uncharacterized protein
LTEVESHAARGSEAVATPAAGQPRSMRWTVRLGSWLIRLLGLTWRIRVVHGATELADVRRRRQPIVFSLWHGDMLPLLYQHRDQGVAVLISEHRDGELIAGVVQRFGFRTVRGSTSRGASRALVGLARTLGEGHDVAVTPDGPRGPARSFAPGAIIAAHRSDAPILACGVFVRRAWHLRSWDRFCIPKPFARVIIAYAGPLLPTGADARAASAETSRFQALMAEAEQIARTAHV